MNDIHLLTGAYALDALDDLERARFRAHLADCPACEAEVGSFLATAAELGALTEVAPPPALRGSVLTAISQVRPAPPVAAPAPAPAAREHVQPEAPVRVPRPRWPLLVAAAALVIVAGVGVTWWSPWGGETSPTPGIAQRVLAADDAVSAVVDLGEAGRATVTSSASEGRAVLRTEDMVAPPEGKVFQVWFQTPSDDMVPAGVMEPVPDQTMVLEGSAADAVGAGITVEPIGGSSEPSGDPIALFDLSEAESG